MQDSDFNLYIQTQDLNFGVSNAPGRFIPRLKALANSYNQIDIYELISVCLYCCNMRMVSETTYSSQTKLIGQRLHVLEYGIGYSNLAFKANKGQKRSIFSLKPLKCLKGL